MFDPITLAVGGLLLAAGYISGCVHRRSGTPKPSQAVCDCEHPLAMHDPDTKACHGETARQKYNKYGEPNGWDHVPCTCRQYVGPKPVEDLFAPTYLPPLD